MAPFKFTAQLIETIPDLKRRVDIVDIIGRHATLKKRGGAYWCRCPLHKDATPSCKVNPARQQFYCFGCGAHGDVIDFLEQAESLDTGQAIQRLKELAGGAGLNPAAGTASIARHAAAAAQEAERAAHNAALARRIWSEAEDLTHHSDPLAVAYLTERRGITRWDTSSLRWHPHCPWRNGTAGCIVAPVTNAADDLTGIWRIRPVMEGEVERLGLGPTRGNFAPVIDPAGHEILAVAEGVEDALAASMLTTYPAVAALSAGNMAVLQLPAQFRQIIICADADPVGIEAAQVLARDLQAAGREVRIIVPKHGKDPNEVLQRRAL